MNELFRPGRRPATPVALLIAASILVAACGAAVPSPAASAIASTPTAASSASAASTATPAASGAASGATSLTTATAPPLACDALVATPAQTEGPYFSAGSPEKSDLREEGMAGTTLVVVGHVVDAACRPITGAKIDVWQADAAGVYDNAGYRLRGHVFSAADGSYRFTTIVPGIYPGRTEHVHVKVTPPGGATVTTQLYFPGVAQNDGDGIFDPAALVAITEAPDGLLGVYTFVL